MEQITDVKMNIQSFYISFKIARFLVGLFAEEAARYEIVRHHVLLLQNALAFIRDLKQSGRTELLFC